MLVSHGAQLENRLRFKLADAFPGHVDLTANLRKGQWLGPIESEAQAKDLLFPFIELGQPTSEMLLLNTAIHPLHWLFTVGVRD